MSPDAPRRLVVVAQMPLSPLQEEQLRRAGDRFEVILTDQPDDALVAQTEVFAGHLDAERIADAPLLRWNHLWSAGADADLPPEMVSAPQVTVTSSAGNGAIPLAEHALMLMLMLDRDAPRWLAAQQRHQWDRYRHPELAGQTVGIVGMGAAGRDLAHKCDAFHMRVLGLRQHSNRPDPSVSRMYSTEQIREFAAECDYLVLAAPLTSATRGMIDAEVIAALKPTAAIINISRGELIEEPALRKAFEKGLLSRAGLDAHPIEPLPPDSPWWAQPGVIITPHNGATTPQTLARAVDIFIENLRRYAEGKRLINLIDKKAGYASNPSD